MHAVAAGLLCRCTSTLYGIQHKADYCCAGFDIHCDCVVDVQVYVYKALTAWLALPMLWALYNAVPPMLFFGSLFLSTDSLHNMCFWMQFVSMLSGLGAAVCLWFVVPVVYTAPVGVQLGM
jgi:hypothetical protein